MTINLDYPLAPVCAAWIEKIKKAQEHKRAKFQNDADEAMSFFNGPHDFMYDPKVARKSQGFQVGADGDAFPDPQFRMTVNRVAEMVQLFGPVLYHRNPYRQVNPRKVPAPPIELFGDPANQMVQMGYQALQQQVTQSRGIDKARGDVLQWYLNYIPTETDLKEQSRMAIDEAIIKGFGCLWTEVCKPPGAQISMVCTSYDSVDNLYVDPDMESFDDAKWICRRCIHPVWEIEQEYNLAPGTLKGSLESYNQQSLIAIDTAGDYDRRRGVSNDLLVYYKIWSRMGIGVRLAQQTASVYGDTDAINETLDTFGDYCYLVVAPGVPYPLNLPPEAIETAQQDEDILGRLEWPTPFWADNDWPVTPIVFHKIPRQVWPMSHLKPALGEMKFINWAYSFLAGKIATTSRDFIAIKKAAAEEIKNAIASGRDLTIIELESQFKDIKEVVQFLQHPQFNGDIWKVIEAVEKNFEKRVGLDELMYGMTGKQMRSAEEASVKSAATAVRPDDMAEKVETAMTKVARKEAMAARWHIKAQDVLPAMGPMGAQLWQQLIESADLYEVVHQLEYRIEAGSTRKPNRERDAANMQQAMQTLFAPMMQYATATGDFTALNKLIADWAKTLDLDASGYLFKPLPLPQLPAAPPPNGAPKPGANAPPPKPAFAGRS